MDFITLLLTAVGLSMDAFSVALCKGLSVKKAQVKQGLLVGLYFGFFQALMPLVGYLLGGAFLPAHPRLGPLGGLCPPTDFRH